MSSFSLRFFASHFASGRFSPEALAAAVFRAQQVEKVGGFWTGSNGGKGVAFWGEGWSAKIFGFGQPWFPGGGFNVSNMILCSPRKLGKWSNLTSICFKWVGSTTNQFISRGLMVARWWSFFSQVHPKESRQSSRNSKLGGGFKHVFFSTVCLLYFGEMIQFDLRKFLGWVWNHQLGQCNSAMQE